MAAIQVAKFLITGRGGCIIDAALAMVWLMRAWEWAQDGEAAFLIGHLYELGGIGFKQEHDSVEEGSGSEMGNEAKTLLEKMRLNVGKDLNEKGAELTSLSGSGISYTQLTWSMTDIPIYFYSGGG
jgi:hypothetical protein